MPFKRYLRRAYAPIERLQRPVSLHERPVFIVGCPHSGTTLLARILDLHPDIYTVRYESQLLKLPQRRSVVRKSFEQWKSAAAAAGKSIVCEKTPRHVYSIDRLFHYFPKARVLVAVRDGRDVAVSMRGRGYSVEAATGLWIRAIEAMRARADDRRVVSVRYETLVVEPQASISQLCRALGEVDASEDMLARYDSTPFALGWDGPIPDERPPEGGNAAGHSGLRTWQVNQPIYDGRGRWRIELSADDLATFDRVGGGEVLRSLGYD